MTTKEWLMRAYKLDREIDMLNEERQKSFDRACRVTGCGASGERVQTSKRNMTADWSIAFIEYTQKIDNRIAELWDVKGEILNAVNRVENSTLRQLLICRYIKFMTWEQVAEELCYSKVHVIHRLHPKALRYAKDVIECNHSGVL